MGGARELVASVLALAAALTTASTLNAQTPTGTIRGRVSDASGLEVPGATVTIASPNLQGVRSTVSSANGDYIFTSVPPGPYTITVELSGFGTMKHTRDVGAGQPVHVDVTLRPAALSEVVTVTGRADAFTNTVQASTNIQQELLATLPTARTILSAVNVSPAAHATGPNNAITIGGAMSADNLFMLDGVQIQDNLRGTPFSLFIEDAIQETTVSTSGISAEYGRFTGGVVTAITKSGGNQFSGSFRTTFTNDDWRTTSPFDEPKVDSTVPTYEFTLGGPIVRNRTWFFGAGRFFEQSQANETGYTRSAYSFDNDEKRYEGKVTQAIAAGHNVRVAYTGITETEANNVWPSPQEVMDLRSLHTRELPQSLLSLQYSGTLEVEPVPRSAILRAPVLVRELRGNVEGSDRRHSAAFATDRRVLVVAELLRRVRTGRAGQRQPVLEEHVFPVNAARVAQHRVRVRHLQRQAQGRQSPVGQRLPGLDHRYDHRQRDGLPRGRE